MVEQTYVVEAREGVNNIAALPDDDEQKWALEMKKFFQLKKMMKLKRICGQMGIR